MGLSLPSDLVADVMRNADPSRLEGAEAKLRSVGTGSGISFASVMKAQPEQWGGGVDSLFSHGPTVVNFQFASSSEAAGTYAGFERMVLRNMLEQLLPEAGSGAFGAGTSASIWRSLAADQLANVYAQAGGIGVASMLSEQDTSNVIESGENQWPYFSASEIRAFIG